MQRQFKKSKREKIDSAVAFCPGILLSLVNINTCYFWYPSRAQLNEDS